MQLYQFIDKAVSAHCSSVGVRCGYLANRALGFLGSRADTGLGQDVLQVLQEHAERDCWESEQNETGQGSRAEFVLTFGYTSNEGADLQTCILCDIQHLHTLGVFK